MHSLNRCQYFQTHIYHVNWGNFSFVLFRTLSRMVKYFRKSWNWQQYCVWYVRHQHNTPVTICIYSCPIQFPIQFLFFFLFPIQFLCIDNKHLTSTSCPKIYILKYLLITFLLFPLYIMGNYVEFLKLCL